MKGLTLTKKEERRIQILNGVIGGELSVVVAAELMGVERASYVATTGRLQEGGSSCHSSREQGEEAGCDH